MASSLLASAGLLSSGACAQGEFEAGFIFDPAVESHGHVHASCIIEAPNGDLRAVWYENGTPLPPPYFSKQRDKSDDVRIGGARKAKDVQGMGEAVCNGRYVWRLGQQSLHGSG